MVVADGLFPFLSEAVIIAIFRRITEYFPFGMVAFNDYGTVGRMNRLAGKLAASQWNFRGFKDAHHPETWTPQLSLVEEASLMHEPEVALFPPLLRLGGHMAARLPAIARKARILCYRF